MFLQHNEFQLGDFAKPSDFANPMYDLGDVDSIKDGSVTSSTAGLYEVSDPVFEKAKLGKEETSFDHKPPTAVLSPSTVIHKSSPQVKIRETALNPTSVDTDKDTQKLVEEDDLSE